MTRRWRVRAAERPDPQIGPIRRSGESTFPHQNPECESVRDFTFYLLPIHYYLETHSGFW